MIQEGMSPGIAYINSVLETALSTIIQKVNLGSQKDSLLSSALSPLTDIAQVYPLSE